MAFKIVICKDLTVCWKFLVVLENYPVNSQVECLIEKPGLGNLLCLSRHDLVFAKTKLLDFRTSSFEILTVFKSNERSKDSYIGLADFFVCFYLRKKS